MLKHFAITKTLAKTSYFWGVIYLYVIILVCFYANASSTNQLNDYVVFSHILLTRLEENILHNKIHKNTWYTPIVSMECEITLGSLSIHSGLKCEKSAN